MLQAPQAGAPITVWVKRMDVADAQYVEVENVDLQQTVSKFKARWVAQEQLDVRPSLVTLRLVKSSDAEPKPEEEAIAKELRPRLTLAAAGLTDGCSLLAFFAGALLGCALCLSSAKVSDTLVSHCFLAREVALLEEVNPTLT